MRVLFVDQTAQLGGGELSLLETLPGLGVEAGTVLFEDGPLRELLQAQGVPVRVLDCGDLLRVRRSDAAITVLHAAAPGWHAVGQLRRWQRGHDAVYANSQKAFVIAALAGWPSGPPLVWHLRDMLTAAHFNPTIRRVAVWLANHQARVVVANSAATAEAFIACGGNPRKVQVIHNGIAAAPFDVPRVAEAAAILVELGLDEQTHLVGLFGRLAPWKGQHVLLEALVKLPGVHALIVGTALFGEDAYAARLYARAERDDLRGRVHFLGFRRDIPALMHVVEVVCHTSVDPEPFGRVIVEGMLAGRPVIASAAGGAVEILEDGVTGLLAPPGDSDALARAIERLLRNPDLGDRLGATAAEVARRDFTLSATQARLASLLHDLPVSGAYSRGSAGSR